MAGSEGSDGMSTCCASWIRRQTRDGVSSSGIGAVVVQLDCKCMPNNTKQPILAHLTPTPMTPMVVNTAKIQGWDPVLLISQVINTNIIYNYPW